MVCIYGRTYSKLENKHCNKVQLYRLTLMRESFDVLFILDTYNLRTVESQKMMK